MMTRGRKAAVLGLLVTLALSWVLWVIPVDARVALASNRTIILMGPCIGLASTRGALCLFPLIGAVLSFGVLAVAVDAAKSLRKTVAYGLFALLWLALGIIGVAPYV
jgi:hypothetical protein